jgi:hypothetical protein
MRVRIYAGGREIFPLSRCVLSGLTWTEKTLSRRLSVIERLAVLKEAGNVRQGGQDFDIGKAAGNPADYRSINDSTATSDSACANHSAVV